MNDAMNETPDDAERRARRKARQKEKRNLRHAHAEGLMLGIVSMLRPGDIALDCGANVGEVTSRLAASGARVASSILHPLPCRSRARITPATGNT